MFSEFPKMDKHSVLTKQSKVIATVTTTEIMLEELGHVNANATLDILAPIANGASRFAYQALMLVP
jgi:hypothetical protein